MNGVMKPPVRLCCMCNREATGFCTTCKCSHYCSIECLQDDRSVHELLCKTYRNRRTQIPPEPGLFRAIFFSTEKPEPEWVWVRMTCQRNEEGFTLRYYTMSYDHIEGLVNCGNSSYDCVLERYHDTIHMLGRLDSCLASSDQLCLDGVPNQSMGKIAPELLECCKGPMLFVGHCAHLNTTSFRHIVDTMYTEHDKWLRKLGDQQNSYISGVRINCVGDRLASERPTFEVCKVAESFYEQDKNLSVSIASKLGIDLVARTIPPGLPWRSRSRGYNGLHFAWNFGFAQINPSEWTASLGSIYVVRKDKKSLEVAHVAALTAYLYSIGNLFLLYQNAL